MEILVWVLHVFVALAIVGLVLIQHGKGADVGAAFGSGAASGTVFGATGSANFLSRATAIMALVFFLTSLGLTYFSSTRTDARGVMSDQPVPGQTAPGELPRSLPAQIPPPQGAAPAGQQAPAPAQPPAQSVPAGTGEGGKVQEVPK